MKIQIVTNDGTVFTELKIDEFFASGKWQADKLPAECLLDTLKTELSSAQKLEDYFEKISKIAIT